MGESVSERNLIEVFKADLESLPIKDVVRKHISTGSPRAFSEHDYFEFAAPLRMNFVCIQVRSLSLAQPV